MKMDFQQAGRQSKNYKSTYLAICYTTVMKNMCLSTLQYNKLIQVQAGN